MHCNIRLRDSNYSLGSGFDGRITVALMDDGRFTLEGHSDGDRSDVRLMHYPVEKP